MSHISTLDEVYYRASGRGDRAGREPPHAQGDDLGTGLAGPHAVGVAAEQDAVAGEVRGDAAEPKAGPGQLQPPLLVQPEG